MDCGLHMRCAIFTQGTSIQWIPNENNFNIKTIALHAIPNNGKMQFWPAFLYWIGFGYFCSQWYEKGIIRQAIKAWSLLDRCEKVNG
jgi:hypothetical protein